MSAPRVAVGPFSSDFATDAVRAGGGEVVEVADGPDSLVWLDPHDVDGLRTWLAEVPDARWVQLPFAGVEKVAEAGVLDEDLRAACLAALSIPREAAREFSLRYTWKESARQFLENVEAARGKLTRVKWRRRLELDDGG